MATTSCARTCAWNSKSLSAKAYRKTKATSPIYRVIGGAFAERTNAEKRLQMLLKAGINDAYIEKV
nr:SPOR domain-containing protein [Virgibacillus halodenitrificans]